MYTLARVIYYLFPVIAFILLIIGIKRSAIQLIISSLWLSLIAIILHFQASGGQILGSYFNYFNSSIYTLTLVVLFVSFLQVISHLSFNHYVIKLISGMVNSFILVGSLIVLVNLWINAFFIENRMEGSPILQIALFNKPEYCSYKYIFYKIAKDGSVYYLCPDHYGLVPSMGRLDVSPDFITTQLSLPGKKRYLLLHQKNT